VLLQQVATLLLKKYQERFQGSPVKATFSYLKEALGRMMPHNPLATHDADRASVRSHAGLLRAMEYRSARLLQSAASRLAQMTKETNAWHAWNDCMSHLVQLANAHVERVVLGGFLARVEAEADPATRATLAAMAELFALDRLHADPVLRNEEYIAPSRAKAMEREVRALCAELRQVAEPLVAAFDIPDFVLRAPIGLHHTQEGSLFDEYLSAVGFGAGGQAVHTHPAPAPQH